MIRYFVWVILIALLCACEQQEKPATALTPDGREARDPTGTVTGEQDLPYPIDLRTGQRVYREVCATCHQEGIAGAPKMGDKEAWQQSISKGLPVLVRHSIDGYQGNLGVMPPKGGAKSLSDEEVASAVVYMVQENR
ncbi:MAG: c-type cytochrome [Desulfuromonadales bacterium]